MPRTGIEGPYTPSPQRVLQTVSDSSLNADLLFLQAWEANPSMNLGVMLRIRQIRRANSQLPAAIAARPEHVKNSYFE